MIKPLPYRELRRILTTYGAVEKKRRGKGSHRILERWVSGQRYWWTAVVHKESDEQDASVVKSARRWLHLMPEDGISDGEFYRR